MDISALNVFSRIGGFPMRFHTGSSICLGAAAIMSVALTITAANADIMPMRTPSGNIECSVGLEANFADVRCRIHNRQGSPASKKPQGCTGAWGHNFELDEQGPVRMTCGGAGPKNELPGVFVIEYGQTEDFGDIRCISQMTGLTCTNSDGHGFFLSRKRQTIK